MARRCFGHLPPVKATQVQGRSRTDHESESESDCQPGHEPTGPDQTLERMRHVSERWAASMRTEAGRLLERVVPDRVLGGVGAQDAAILDGRTLLSPFESGGRAVSCWMAAPRLPSTG